MTERLELYRCEVCGNTVQVLLEGFGQLTCCGQPMLKMTPHTDDTNAAEKHVPVFEKTDNGIKVRIGSQPHPMAPEHYIMFVETFNKDKSHIELQYLQPEDEPAMFLKFADEVSCAIEYCNVHGLWEGKNDK